MFSIFYNINQFAKKYKWLDISAIFFARFLPYLMVAFLFIFCLYQKIFYLFFLAMISGGLARLFNEMVHIFYKKKRPAHLENAKVLIPVSKNFSFPSGHASFFFGLSFYLFFYFKILGIIFILFSVLMGTARVFCGAHWFRDILGGIAMGFLCAIIIYYLNISLL